ncbi:MAG: ribonuclease Z [Desulfurococcales archaeon]|nr:ribonuclease Z [Desulfurococcales archaeon]
MKSLKLIVLGASGPHPGSDDLPSILVVYGRNALLLDAGEGVQHRIKRSGYSVAKVKIVLISHLHGDHVLGLLPLLQSRSLGGCRDEIHIVGPPGIKEFIEDNVRILKFEPLYDIIIHEVLSQELVIGNVRIYSFPVKHVMTTLAYVVSVNDIKLTYVTDTRPLSTFPDTASKPDVLIHDSTFASDMKDKAEEYGHSTSVDAAEAARNLGAKLLLLYHISPRYKNRNQLLYEAKRFFNNTHIAEQYMKVLVLKRSARP